MIRLSLTIALLATALPASAQVRTYGGETVIRNGASGGIRTTERGAPDGSVLYLQDRMLRWYRVTLSGPCFPDLPNDTLIYRTVSDDRIDRFTTIGSRRYPGRVCGVRSILRSDAPPQQPPVRPPTPRELARQPRG